MRQTLGTGVYREVLRDVLRARTDPESGRSWTPVQELVCRCPFKAVITTNYDPGIVDARMNVRPGASATGFTTWEDELGLDRWRTGDAFAEAELPVLFAHGQHNRPDSVVLATTEYRRAYAGKLPQVLARLVDGGRLAWIGFSFNDQRVAAILREIADRTGTRVNPGEVPRHVAVMAWDPDAEGSSLQILARRAEIAYGAQVVLYPAPAGDNSALQLLLSGLTDPRFPSAVDPPGHRPVSTPRQVITQGVLYSPPERDPVPSQSMASDLTQLWAGVQEPATPVGHAFISYVREDSAHVDRLQRALEAAGVPVWRDTAELWPGEDWREKIRHAITHDALVFLACFSSKSLGRAKSYQNAELALAIDQLRLRLPGQPWLIPIRFDDCDVPELDIGGGRSLAWIQRADLFGDYFDYGLARLITVVQRILGRDKGPF